MTVLESFNFFFSFLVSHCVILILLINGQSYDKEINLYICFPTNFYCWGISLIGRALDSKSKGQVFDSLIPQFLSRDFFSDDVNKRCIKFSIPGCFFQSM